MSQSQPRRSKLVRTKGEDYVPKGTKIQRTRGDNYRGIKNGYDPEAIELAKHMSKNGATTGEIAEALGISRPTLWAWMNNNEDMFNAVKVGGLKADERVEQTLYERASNGESDTAIIFWLKNRQPNRWRDKRDVELGGAVDIADNTSRSLALAALALIRQAVEEPSDGLTIEHQEAAE